MPDYVVMKLLQSDPELWRPIFVDVSAGSPEAAIEEVAKDGERGGEGVYVAVPNELWVGRDVRVKRIAEVEMERVELV